MEQTRAVDNHQRAIYGGENRGDTYETPPSHSIPYTHSYSSPSSSTDNFNHPPPQPGSTPSSPRPLVPPAANNYNYNTYNDPAADHDTPFNPYNYASLNNNPFADQSPFAPQSMSQSAYNNIDTGATQQSTWLEKQQASNKRSKRIVIGTLVGIVVVIAVAVGVGVTVAKHKPSNKSSGGLTGGNSNDNGGTVPQTDPNDPSTFVKDPRLHQAFYGMAYTPEGAQLPQCGANLPQVITDIQLLSQLTKRIRLYGADCNQTALVLEAIKQTKVDMMVYPGIYNVPNDGGAAYTRQKQILVDALQKYGTKNIAGITVGNEWMLNYLVDHGGADISPNSATGDQGGALLMVNITDMRNTLSSMSITLPVGTSDAGSYFNNKVLGAVDYGMANVHPWFANVSAQQGAAWTADFFTTTDIAAAQAVTNHPDMYIAETGWPTKSSDAGNANNGASDASEANLQTFLDTFVCQANTNGTKYFYFEYFDETWKDKQFGGVEGWWGLFNSNRTLKNINIPTCQTP